MEQTSAVKRSFISEQMPLAIHVEDYEDWRETVKEYIDLKSSIEFAEIIQGSSIQEVRKHLENVTQPLVVIIDLRIDEASPLYEGYHWLLEEWPAFSRKHPQASIFVISGELDLHDPIQEGIIETLVRRGIPEDHIFRKSRWDEERDQFIEVMDEALRKQMDAKETSANNIDPYIEHIVHHAAVSDSDRPESLMLPILIRTTTKEWKYDSVPDLQVLGQIETIYACVGSMRSMEFLQNDPEVIKVEASRPSGGYDCSQSVPFVNGSAVHNDIGEKGDRVIVALVDSGIDIFHKAFRKSDGTTRIKAIWNQNDTTGTSPEGFLVGTEYKEREINNFLKKGTVPDLLRTTKKDHGTHVAGIAAGSPTNNFAGGVAPEAHLLLVIPSIDVPGVVSIGYSNSHMLALEYIRKVADEENLPVVINVSQGQNAGAHDGTSNLEKAFDGITAYGQQPGIVVIKSAGNERDKRIHAKLKLSSTSQAQLDWKVKSSDRGRDVLELWFKASYEFHFRLFDPRNKSTPWVTWDQTVSGNFPSGNAYCLTYTKFDRDNGDSRLIVSVSRGTHSNVLEGEWNLEIVSENVKGEGEIHAWLERNIERSTEFLNHLDEEVTLSIPGTANHVIAVGSVLSSMPLRLSPFSAYGPTRDGRSKPDLSAPGENIGSSASHSDDGITTMSGTSMAAPHVTGAIALLLSRGEKRIEAGLDKHRLNSAQIQAGVVQGVKSYSGSWNRGTGYGVLDIEAFFRVFGFA